MLTLENSEAVIRSHNMRMTPQRRAVMLFLEGNDTHPTVEEVAKHVQESMPNVALSTVYNTLHELADLGLVSKVEVDGIMRFDPQEKPHAHFSCSSCGRVFDIDLSGAQVKSLLSSVNKAGFACEHTSVSFLGVCPQCAS